MRYKSTIIIFYIFLNFLVFTTPVLSNQKQTIYPLKDAFVGDLYPDDNTGDDGWLWISMDNINTETCEAFIYFELPFNYYDYDIIKFHFYIVLGVDEIFHVNFFRITQNWNELTINWTNKPSQGEFLFTTQLSSHRTYDIDVKEYLTSNILSFCITASYPQYNLGQIPSSENEWYAEWGELPCIILRDSNLPIIIGVVIIGIVGVSGALGYIFYKKRNKVGELSQ